jgi:hypothetical protein
VPPPIVTHIPTASEVDCHLVERINNDGTIEARDKNTGKPTFGRLGVLVVAGQLTAVIVGPGSG